MKQQQQRAAMMSDRRGGDDDDMGNRGGNRDEYNADVDEIDFGYDDEFQDDDHGFLFGEANDDEAKETEQRLREEMREAGLGAATGIKDDTKDWDAEEQKKREEEAEEKRMTKRLRKQLMKKERKMEYDSDSEHGEFSEDSESEDSDEERERLEEEKKQKEEEEAKKLNGDKSGASTRGTNTPNGRAEKKDHARLGHSLKRPGSPDLSEVSGNESSRKKIKVNGASATNGTRVPGRAGGSGSTSETEGANREGRPMIRIKNSPPGSPNASRAGTPSGSRAQSPQRTAPTFPTAEEVRQAIPAEGITITELIKPFRPRIVNRQNEFINLVKAAGKQDSATKKIMPKQEQA